MKSLGAPIVRPEGGLETAWVPAGFEKAAVSLKIVFDAAGRIAGFRVMPGGPPAEWSPAPYSDPKAREREVTVGSGEWAVPGTLTLPAGGAGLFPALVLIHGSGPQDRDETVGGTKVFRDLAGGLAARGIAVLRFEKRTKAHGARMKDLAVSVREEVVDDALSAAALLRARPEIDAAQVALLGHSLGGMLAPRITAADPKLAGIAIVSGNVRPLHVLGAEQLDYLVAAGSATKEQVAGMKAEFAKAAALDPKRPPAPGTRILGAPAEYWLELAAYDPAATARSLAIPILVVAGGRDYQVTTKELDAWKAALAGRPNVTVRLFPKLNHLLVEGEGPSVPAEYERTAHVSEEVVEAIAAWTRALPPRTAP
jgi:dienelactone hydrolase